MKIVVLQGSPNMDGSTAMMVDEFTKGAQSVGHTVVRIDVGRANVNPCTGCVRCGYEGPCIQHDGMDAVREDILASDMVAFATPLYYYGMSAQLKIVLDRFCSANFSITSKRMKCALLAVAWNSDNWTFDSLVSHYQTIVRYLSMQDQGMVLGYGCGTLGMTKHSPYLREAYELGASLQTFTLQWS